MNKLFYPAIFHEAEEGGFWVEFPDIPEMSDRETICSRLMKWQWKPLDYPLQQ